jgi:hypothetical protein
MRSPEWELAQIRSRLQGIDGNNVPDDQERLIHDLYKRVIKRDDNPKSSTLYKTIAFVAASIAIFVREFIMIVTQ